MGLPTVIPPVRYTTRIIVPPRPRRSGQPGGPGSGPRPQAVGVRKSIGFGDPLGLATTGHVAVALEHPDFVPFFAQQSVEGMASAGRTPQDVLAAAARAVGHARYRQPWGADADLLRSPQDVDETASAGFTYFTIDLSAHVRDEATDLPAGALAAMIDGMVADGELPEDWAAPYLDRDVELSGGETLRLGLDALSRAAVKYGRAIQHGARMYETISRANRGRPYEIEVSLDQAASTVSTAEHLFLGLELEARGVRMTGLALRLDDRDPVTFEAALREHVALASFCGPYKLSFRGGTHDPALVPVIGRCCGDSLHYKTSADSYLEALRLTWRMEPELFQAVLGSSGLTAGAGNDDPEAACLDDPANSRQLAQVSSAVLASGHDGGGRALRTALLELLERHADAYQELIVIRFGRLLQQLNAG